MKSINDIINKYITARGVLIEADGMTTDTVTEIIAQIHKETKREGEGERERAWGGGEEEVTLIKEIKIFY